MNATLNTLLIISVSLQFISFILTILQQGKNNSKDISNLKEAIIEKIHSNDNSLKEVITNQLSSNHNNLTQNYANLTERNNEHNIKLTELINKHINENTKDNNSKHNELKDLIDNYNKANTEEIQNKHTSLMDQMRDGFLKIRELIDEKIRDISNKTEASIKSNFEQAAQTFQAVLTRLTKMDEVQKEMQNLSKNVVSLDGVLSNNKTIGAFGEVQLHQVLQNVFGDNRKYYDIQHTLSNDSRPDAVIFFPDPTGKICVDSKFPLSHYKEMMNAITERNDAKYKHHETEFRSSIAKNIKDIASKYITDETGDFAIMFVPSEAVFAEIASRHYDKIEHAQKNKIFIASPTTLMAICNAVHATIMKIEISKNAELIKSHLGTLSEEFDRYYERWTRLESQLQTVSKTAGQINTTSKKIKGKFEEIKNSDSKQLATDGREAIKMDLDQHSIHNKPNSTPDDNALL